MMIKIIWTVALSGVMVLFLSSWCLAATESDTSFTDNVIASTFKALAKVFTAASDLDKIKLNNIKKIRNMTDEKFIRRYAEIYNLLKDYPYFCKRYGFSAEMTRDKIMLKIAALDKKTIYEMIDTVPARLVGNEFEGYLNQRQIDLQKSNLSIQIQQFWNQVVKSATGG